MKILSKIKAIYAMFMMIFSVILVVIPLMYIFRKTNRKIRKAWAKLQKYVLGYKIIKKGEIDKNANMLLINHQTLLDIVVLEELHPKDLCWITKEEIQKIPLFGHVVNAPRMIAIQRNDKRSLIKMLKDVRDRLDKGRVLAIFPEGTRSDGKKLLKFKGGAKLIAKKYNLTVQPVVIANAINILDSKTLNAKSGDVSITFLPSVKPTDDDSWYENVKSDMEKVLENELSKHPSHR